jgi:hypothetical protein
MVVSPADVPMAASPQPGLMGAFLHVMSTDPLCALASVQSLVDVATPAAAAASLPLAKPAAKPAAKPTVKAAGKAAGKPKAAARGGSPCRRCSCKKSKCLKLYCECFMAQVYCDGCQCTDCLNTVRAAMLASQAGRPCWSHRGE